MRALSVAALALCLAPSTSQTFGNGLAGVPICPAPLTLLNYSLPANASHAVLHHFWATGAPLKIDRIIVEYYLDGEATPSIAFQPAAMCGLFFPQFAAPNYEYSAGGLCGKSAPVGGFHNTFPIPFYRSAVVTVRSDPTDGAGCLGGYLSIRGTVGLALAVPGSGRALPMGTRLVLQASPLALRQPLEFVQLAALPRGQSGEVFLTAWAVEAQPVGGPAAGGGYIEGCWNFYPTAGEAYPGLVVGTGVEDYYDSGYYFGADSGDAVGILFANALSGLTLFQRDAPSGAERLSAYRFHNTDPLVFTDGGQLTWQVGAEAHPGATKCGNPLPPAAALHPGTSFLRGNPLNASRALSPVNVTTYAWVYVYPGPYACSSSAPGGAPACTASSAGAWGNSASPDCCSAPPPPPAPPAPPPTPSPPPAPSPGPPAVVGCASGLCSALCSNPAVRGCAAGGWGGAGMDLRAPASGAPCGGPLGPCAASAADACGPGWGLCLAGAASDASALVRLRANLTAGECEGVGGGAFVAAMSHASPAFESLPPRPCPPAPVAVDNGCAAEGWGAEPVCCGGGCALPSCPNSVWLQGTRIHEDEGSGCGALKPGAVSGVLCCRE